MTSMTRAVALPLLFAIAVWWGFFALAEMMLSGDLEVENIAIMQGIPAWHAGWLTFLMTALTHLGSAFGMTVVAFLSAAYLRRKGDRLDGSIAILLLLGAAFWTFTLKGIYQHPRPQVFPPLLSETGYSFPSGHSLTSWCLFGYLAAWAGEHRRPLMALGFVALAMLIPLSRLYLGVHWPTDVLGGLFVGTFWLGLCLALRRYLLDRKRRKGRGRPPLTRRQRRRRLADETG